jgi:hypothetical protein
VKKINEDLGIGVVASDPRETAMMMTPKVTSLKLCVDVLFDGKLHRNIPIDELELL